jgi:hypothetical protein
MTIKELIAQIEEIVMDTVVCVPAYDKQGEMRFRLAKLLSAHNKSNEE